MKKVLSVLLLAALMAFPLQAFASPWAIVAVNNPEEGNGIFTIDCDGSNPRVYGPFLKGQIGTEGGGIFDVVVVPNGRSAIVSNFGDSKIFRFSIVDPRKPVRTGVIDIGFFAEDIAVSQDGTFAIVSDGGFSPRIAFVDLQGFKLKGVQELKVPDPENPGSMIPAYANAVAIARDNKTVIMADYFSGKAVYGKVNADKNKLTGVKSIFLCSKVNPADETECNGTLGRPVNVAISHDGQTALLSSATDGLANTLRITGPGEVEPGGTFFVRGLPVDDNLSGSDSFGGNQSIVFTPDNRRAYVLTQPLADVVTNAPNVILRKNRVVRLQLLGPGRVSVHSDLARLSGAGTSQLFGVDNLAIDREGRYLIGTNPTMSGATNVLTLVHLWNKRAIRIPLAEDAIPLGVAFK